MPVFSREDISRHFRGLYLTKVRDVIAGYLVKEGTSVLEINAYLVQLSEHLQELISPIFDEYGIKLLNFFVKDINVPEDDPAVIKLKSALAKRAEMNIVGYNYTQKRSFDTLQSAAENSGGGQAGIMGAAIGLGTGVGLGTPMGAQMAGLAQNLNVKDTSAAADTGTCGVCGASFSGAVKFCPECGKPTSKTCPKCSARLHNGKAKFCQECGESLTRVCEKCGTAVEEKQKFCLECGTKLEA